MDGKSGAQNIITKDINYLPFNFITSILSCLCFYFFKEIILFKLGQDSQFFYWIKTIFVIINILVYKLLKNILIY